MVKIEFVGDGSKPSCYGKMLCAYKRAGLEPAPTTTFFKGAVP